jgi:hypothetical protein
LRAWRRAAIFALVFWIGIPLADTVHKERIMMQRDARMRHPARRTHPAMAAAVLVIAAASPALAQAGGKAKAAAPPPTGYSAPAGAPYTAQNVTIPTPMGHTLAGSARPRLGTQQYQLRNNIMHDTSLTPAQRDSKIDKIPHLIDSLSAADPWMKYFLNFNPAATDSLVKTPVLILTGANDQQASPEQNPEIAAAFKGGGNPDVTARVLPNLNHLFVHDTNGYPGGYTKLPPPVRMEPEVVGIVADWLVERLR